MMIPLWFSGIITDISTHSTDRRVRMAGDIYTRRYTMTTPIINNNKYNQLHKIKCNIPDNTYGPFKYMYMVSMIKAIKWRGGLFIQYNLASDYRQVIVTIDYRPIVTITCL